MQTGTREKGREGGREGTYLERQWTEVALVEEGLDKTSYQGLFRMPVLVM